MTVAPAKAMIDVVVVIKSDAGAAVVLRSAQLR